MGLEGSRFSAPRTADVHWTSCAVYRPKLYPFRNQGFIMTKVVTKVVAGIDLPAFFMLNFLFYLVVISGNSLNSMLY